MILSRRLHRHPRCHRREALRLVEYYCLLISSTEFQTDWRTELASLSAA